MPPLNRKSQPVTRQPSRMFPDFLSYPVPPIVSLEHRLRDYAPTEPRASILVSELSFGDDDNLPRDGFVICGERGSFKRGGRPATPVKRSPLPHFDERSRVGLSRR